jgi:hypothetical protein
LKHDWMNDRYLIIAYNYPQAIHAIACWWVTVAVFFHKCLQAPP